MSVATVRGHEAHYLLLGRDEPLVVFVHGMMMDNLASWYFTMANQVAERHRVLLYDLRGHGRSERTEDGYTVADLVADLDALLDVVGEERPVVLVGNSFGGLVALAYTMAHPDRVRALVTIDGNMHDEHWNDDIAERFDRTDEDPEALRAEIMRYSYRYAGRDSPRKRNQLGRRAWQLVHRTTFVDDLASTPPFDDDDLAAVTCPVLTLYGTESELAERARRMAAGLPRCESIWFEGCTHLLLWEDPEGVRDAVMDWLERLE